MTLHLALGIFCLLVGSITIGYRFVAPEPHRSASDPYAGTLSRSWFTVLSLGVVPIITGMFFVGAWWHERPHEPVRVPQRAASEHARASAPAIPAPTQDAGTMKAPASKTESPQRRP